MDSFYISAYYELKYIDRSVGGPVVEYFAAVATDQISQSWAWYVTRASGMVAAVLLGLLIASGVGLLTGATYRLLEPIPAWVAHRAIGIAFAVLVLLHGVVLLFDKFVGFSLLDVLLPFHSSYNQTTLFGVRASWYMAFGIVATYCLTLVVITSLLWMQKRPQVWRSTHYLSYAVLVLVFAHGLFMGTDLKQGLLRLIWLLGGGVLLVLLLPRLRRVGTLSQKS